MLRWSHRLFLITKHLSGSLESRYCTVATTSSSWAPTLRVLDEPLKYTPTPLAGRKFLPGSRKPNFPRYLSPPNNNFPVVLKPEDPVKAQRFAVRDWAQICREAADKILPNAGAILFRGLPLQGPNDFDTLIGGMGHPVTEYKGGAGYRKQLSQNVFTASDEPPQFTIDLHTEMSYLKSLYPKKLAFFCVQPPEDLNGGDLPIAHLDGMLDALDPVVLDKLLKKGVRYYRHMGDKSVSKYMTWQKIFHTEDKDVVERFCREQGFEFTWHEDKSITYHYTLPVTIDHPVTGKSIWFNQVVGHHSSCYYDHPDFMGERLEPTKYPLNTSYGDGEEFTEEDISNLRIAHWKKAVGFHWQHGDVLLLDNFQAMHGRVGTETPQTQRKILASLFN
ncbi:dapdiamide synthesis protein DdaC-like [Glandiceps talaboti]